jgi:predicted membrane protein
MTRQDRNVITGLIILVVGIVLLLNSIGLIEYNIWRLAGKFWPLILIIIGLIIILEKDKSEPESARQKNGQSGISEDKAYHESTAFGLFGDIRIAGMPEMAGDLHKNLLIGDIVIDLTGSKLAQGDNQIEVSLLIGDIDIIIPHDYSVSIDLNCLIGSVSGIQRKSDGFAANIRSADDNFLAAPSRLKIHARALIGDITVTRLAGAAIH